MTCAPDLMGEPVPPAAAVTLSRIGAQRRRLC